MEKPAFPYELDGIGAWLSSNSGQLIDLGYGLVQNIFNAFVDAGDVISENIGKFVPLIADAFTAYHEALFTVGLDILGAIGQGLVENKDEIQHWISLTIENMVTSLRDNAPAIIEGGLALLEALVGAIMENMPLILETGAEIIGQLALGISTSMPTLIAAVALILPQIAKVIDVVENIGGAVQKAAKLVGENIDFVLGIGGKLMGGIKALFTLAMNHPFVAIAAVIIGVITMLWTHCEEFREFVKGAIDAIVGFVSGAVDLVVGLFSALVDGIGNILSGLAEFIGGVFTAAFELASGAWDAAVEVFAGIGEGIQSAFEAVTEFLGDAFSAAWDVISTVWNIAVGFFSGIWDSISSAAETAAGAVGDALSGAWEAVTSVWDGALDFFGGIWEDIKGVFSDVWDRFKEIGGNIVQGIWDGISGAWGQFWSWLSGKVGGIIDGVKSMLGIHSPSTVFAGIGKNMALGLAEGWDDQYSGIKRQIEGGLSFAPATVGISGLYSGTYGGQSNAQGIGQAGAGKNLTINIYNPEKRDAVTEAREWTKTCQRMALGYM